MATLGHSEKCLDLTTYWNKYTHKCVPCQLQPGHEVTPNCGRDDDDGVHELPASPCKQHTFNDGSRPYCQPCSSCQPNSYKVENCTSTRDTLCNRRETTTAPSTNETHQEATSAQPGMSHVSATVYLDILSAPLQAVLDDLDVLEELIILLDPETVGIKNTKNLASQCSFSAAWITYTYSMKDSKSPLKVVLEGVTSKHPDWTVGHLAKLLRQIQRNDAVAVLAKLKPKGMC
ncbi:IGF-like family receptor 1 isoform 3-T3 [Menidia menidia]